MLHPLCFLVGIGTGRQEKGDVWRGGMEKGERCGKERRDEKERKDSREEKRRD